VRIIGQSHSDRRENVSEVVAATSSEGFLVSTYIAMVFIVTSPILVAFDKSLAVQY